MRLTGRHETQSIDKFSWGISDRGSSIRVPQSTAKNWIGYLEDRRPASNADPYQIVDPAVFFPLLGDAPAPPRVVYLYNGNVKGDWDFNSFSTDALKAAIKK